MNPQDFVLLAIEAVGGNVVGRAKLENIIFFAALHTDSLDMFRYRERDGVLHSRRVQDALDALRKAGALAEYIDWRYCVAGGSMELSRHEFDVTYFGAEFAAGLRSDHKYAAVVQALDRCKGLLSWMLGVDDDILFGAAKNMFEKYRNECGLDQHG